jgi:hypothetical protein
MFAVLVVLSLSSASASGNLDNYGNPDGLVRLNDASQRFAQIDCANVISNRTACELKMLCIWNDTEKSCYVNKGAVQRETLIFAGVVFGFSLANFGLFYICYKVLEYMQGALPQANAMVQLAAAPS